MTPRADWPFSRSRYHLPAGVGRTASPTGSGRRSRCAVRGERRARRSSPREVAARSARAASKGSGLQAGAASPVTRVPRGDRDKDRNGHDKSGRVGSRVDDRKRLLHRAAPASQPQVPHGTGGRPDGASDKSRPAPAGSPAPRSPTSSPRSTPAICFGSRRIRPIAAPPEVTTKWW